MEQTVWKKNTGDVRTNSDTVLVLRSDGTYTKYLSAAVSGHPMSGNFGGAHDGTWRSEGDQVYLSGDGNWPAYVEDLSGFTRLDYL